MSEYESRLDHELLSILQSQRIAALATLQADGTPFVSLAPYAIDGATGRVVLQVSALAPHGEHMRDDPRVSLLMIAPEAADLPASSLPRITFQGRAEFLRDGSAEWQASRAAFFERFPDSGSMHALLDYDFVVLTLHAARQTSGFGASRSVPAESLVPLLQEDHKPAAAAMR
jgi:putative heme iron utilization protein